MPIRFAALGPWPGILAGLLILALPSVAAGFGTPGAVASIEVPEGFTARYEPTADVTMLDRAGSDQILLFVAPGMPPRVGMDQLLRMFGARHLAPRVESARLSGYEGVRLDVQTEVYESWFVLAVDGASVVVRAASRNSFDAVAPATATLLAGLRLAPARHPRSVVGSYSTGSTSSPGAGAGQPSVHVQSGVILAADGRLREEGRVGASGDFGTLMGDSGTGGTWEVRGDRLLLRREDDSVSNLRFEAFSNGLELVDEQGTELLWVRR